MFNFDGFINAPAINIFGEDVVLIPLNDSFVPFTIKGDFHEDYKEVSNNVIGVDINSSELVIFIRNADLPDNYQDIKQGDKIVIKAKTYEIIAIQPHIVGGKKLILHESQ